MGWVGLYRAESESGVAARTARPFDSEESEPEAATRIAGTLDDAFGPKPIETIGPRSTKKGVIGRRKRGR